MAKQAAPLQNPPGSAPQEHRARQEIPPHLHQLHGAAQAGGGKDPSQGKSPLNKAPG